MRISGFSNQWKTRDGLVKEFAASPDGDRLVNERARAIRELLLHLESLDGPDLWVGTSHRLLNFALRDAKQQSDRVPSYVTVEASDIDRDEVSGP